MLCHSIIGLSEQDRRGSRSGMCQMLVGVAGVGKALVYYATLAGSPVVWCAVLGRLPLQDCG
jgi:hypothetical protein